MSLLLRIWLENYIIRDRLSLIKYNDSYFKKLLLKVFFIFPLLYICIILKEFFVGTQKYLEIMCVVKVEILLSLKVLKSLNNSEYKVWIECHDFRCGMCILLLEFILLMFCGSSPYYKQHIKTFLYTATREH